MKRKSEKDYHELAKSRGFKWVGEVLPKNTHTETLWECEKGDRWEAKYNKIKQGSGCPVCKRKIERDYHTLAESRGFKWVGVTLPKNTRDLTWWECEKGDRWEARYNNIQQGSGCPVCNIKIERDYRLLAKSRGFKWVGGVRPESTKYPTLWECERGDRWEASYDGIRGGSGCPVCSGNIRKTEKDYHSLAKSRGFKWLGVVLPKDTITPTLWECEFGDRWEAKYHGIQRGKGCPVCAGILKKTEKDYHMLAESRGFKWVGSVLPDYVKDLTWWECKKGHRWEACYNKIQQGRGCSTCKDLINGVPVSKPQRKLNVMLCGHLNYLENRYRIDVAIIRNSQKIAVEYDAQYWHTGREKEDTKRDNFLISRGWKVLHIKSSHLLPARKQLKDAIRYLLKTENKIYNLYLEDWK